MGRGDIVLAIDIGTSSSRAALFDAKGRRAARSLVQRAYALRTDRDGRAELNPRELLEAVEECVRGAAGGSEGRHEKPPLPIAGVGVSCFWHSLLGTDERGEPVTPIFTWADARCREDAAELREKMDEREVHAETGCMLRASFWPAKLQWLRKTQRAVFRRVRFWMSPGEWLQWRLAGESRCAIGMATGTGLFDPTKQQWSERMFDVCGIRQDQVLPVSDDPVEWRSAAWYPAIGDGAASNLGSGAVAEGTAAINIGTSAALRVMREGRRARAPFGLFAYRVDARRFLVGGAVSNAGNLHAWCLRELNLPSDVDEVETLLAGRPKPEHGLTVLPFWTAERAPSWNEDDTGVIQGVTQGTRALDLLQAITEASYQRLAMIAAALTPRRGGPPKWIVSGGALKSRSALHRLANVFGMPMHVSKEPEASLRGAAVFALEKLGHSIEPAPVSSRILPDEEIYARYREQRRNMAELERLVSGRALCRDKQP
jgi:gluconokinase